MTARHRDDGGRRGEEMIAADWTVALGGTRETLVRGGVRDGYANVAALAVVEVFAQTFSSPADTTVWAVVDLLLAVIVPELTNVTIVTCSFRLTLPAHMGCWLGCSACHAQHVLCQLPVQIVVLDCIVAVSACVPAAAFEALHLDIALVMLTAQYELPFSAVVVVVFAVFSTSVVMMGSVRGGRVALSKIVRDVGGDVRGRRVGRGCMDVGEEGLARGRGKGAVV